MTATHPQLLVYKASAGSGKTFTLAIRYISQLIEDPRAYRRILAVTFTNKATAEMKSRILEQLYGLAHNLKSSEGYLNELHRQTGRSYKEIQESANAALQNIIHDYSRFRIETIDSFFQSVMKNLSRELKLGTNLNIELNNADVLSEAVDYMIENLSRKSPVLGWLLEYIEEQIANDKRWDVSKEIKSFGLNIFNEVYIEKGDRLRKKLADQTFIPHYRKELKDIQNAVLDQMKGFETQFLEILNDNGLSIDSLAHKANGIAGYFRKLGRGELSDDKVCNQTLTKCMADSDCWVPKTAQNRNYIIALAESQLRPILNDAEKIRPANHKLLNSCNLSLKHLNNLRLLTCIDAEIRQLNQRNNRFLLSDTNALLHGLISKGDATFVYEKIGTNIDTVMIDEFQDTSRMQWENFHLLLEECLSQKEGSLIVGDIKQSIYRWRNGDWKILADIDHDPTLRVNEQTLGTNWRSEPVIIRFNNELFTAACQELNNRYINDMGKPCQQLLNAYSDVCQQAARQTDNGYVKVSLLPEGKESPYREQVLKELVNEVKILTGQGIQANDIAILVRKNKDIPLIAEYFDKNAEIRIVSDEAFRLDASLAICMMIDGLRYLTSPENTVAQARLALEYQKDILGKDIDINTVLLNDIDQYLPAEFLLQKKELRFMPLYELLEKLFVVFNMNRIKQQDAYLCAFYDAVTEYMQNNSSELTAFISFWDEHLSCKTIPSGEIEGIRILSIHKSKGLECHTVLIPYCDWKMENESSTHLIWCAPDKTIDNKENVSPFNELDIVPINYSQSMSQSVYRNSYLDEKLQLWVDSLNLLYVAFTRACKNLIIWGCSTQKGTVSELLSQAITQVTIPQANLEETEQAYGKEKEEARRYEFGKLSSSEEKRREQSDNRLNAAPEGIPIRMESMETDFEFKQSNRSADFICGKENGDKTSEYIQQGELLHQVFASIDTTEDVDQAIDRLCFEGIIESERQEQQIRNLAKKALTRTEVTEWYDGTWNLHNECSIIYTDEEGNMQIRRPDRVMEKDGEVIVVDFKFGKKKGSYVTQVQEYMQLLYEMGYNRIKGYLWYVFSNDLTKVEPQLKF